MFGNKARSLQDLDQLGFNVPRFFVVNSTVRPVTPHELSSELTLLRGESFAVRSSSSAEDGQEHSFAGLFETYLAVPRSDVAEHVMKCIDSLQSERVREYCRRKGLDSQAMKMAVIVQEFIEPDVAGVAFTVNPVTGDDDEMLVEICAGRGERLVSGHVRPDQYRIFWRGEPLIKTKTPGEGVAITEATLRQLRQDLQRIQAAKGRPQDIEFAIKEGVIYFLQSRDVTKIQYGPDLGEWSTADFRDGGISSAVVSPILWQLYERAFTRTLPAYFKLLRLIDDRKLHSIRWYRIFYGRAYWNLRALKNVQKQLPGYNERNFDKDMSIPPTYAGEGVVTPMTLRGVLRFLPTLVILEREFKRQEKRSRQLLEEFAKIESKHHLQDFSSLSVHELGERLEDLLQDHALVEGTYFQTIYNASNAKLEFSSALGAFKKIDPEIEYVHLISDLGNMKVTEPVKVLSDIARRHVAAAPLLHSLLQGESEKMDFTGLPEGLAEELYSFVTRFYHHSERELDLRVPRWIEDPGFILRTLSALMDAPHVPDSQSREQHLHKVYRDAIKRLKKADVGRGWKRFLPMNRLVGVLAKLERVRRFLFLREELRDCSTKIYYVFRRWALATGRATGLGDQIFYAQISDLQAFFRGELSEADFRLRLDEIRHYAEGYREFKNDNEIGYRFSTLAQQPVAPPPEGTGARLTGIGCSAGRIRATARVIRSIHEARNLKAGEILVVPFTDPGWTPLFSLAAGVITETGGLLSHAALISREYGLPAVLNVNNATGLIRDGSAIEIDGTSGEIFLDL